MFVDSYLKHNRLILDHVDISGRDLAFDGAGWIDTKTQNIDLTLAARGKRLATEEPSVLQSLTESLGLAVVRMDITGNIYDPNVETTPLPVDSKRIPAKIPVNKSKSLNALSSPRAIGRVSFPTIKSPWILRISKRADRT